VTSDLTYPAREGKHQHAVSLICALRGHGIDAELATLCRDESRLDLNLMERETGIRLIMPPIPYSGRSLVQGVRLLTGASRNRAQLRLLHESLRREFDVVHLEDVAALGIIRRDFARRTVVSLLDPRSLRHWRLARSSERRLEALYQVTASVVMAVTEFGLSRAAGLLHVVSAPDASYLRRRYRTARVVSVPMMLSPEQCRVMRDATGWDSREDHHHRGKPTVVVPVDLRAEHLRRSLRKLGGALSLSDSEAVHGAHYLILTRVNACDRDIDAWAGLDVEFVPWVDDFRAALGSADAVVLPDDVGTGLKYRAVVALALGLPVAGTRMALEGIPVVHGESALVAKCTPELGTCLEWILTDQSMACRMAQSGRATALALTDPNNVCAAWFDAYRRVVEGSP
jgi:glycosyltransferase involved in cell wall biosynthesis